jgi:hypothetical protein
MAKEEAKREWLKLSHGNARRKLPRHKNGKMKKSNKARSNVILTSEIGMLCSGSK